MVGGNLVEYPYELTTRTADLITSKILWNNVISTPGGKIAAADIKHFCLNTPLDRYEYMYMLLKLTPQAFIEQYNLQGKAKNGYVYIKIQKGMYGLPQAGILANKLLKQRLGNEGYYEQPHTPGLFRHEDKDIYFTLVMDDLDIKYGNRDIIDHLLGVLTNHYDIELIGKENCIVASH